MPEVELPEVVLRPVLLRPATSPTHAPPAPVTPQPDGSFSPPYPQQPRAPWSAPGYPWRRGRGGWVRHRLLARPSLPVRWPVLIVLVAAGWSAAWLITVLGGPSGLVRRPWVLVEGAVGLLACAAGLGLLIHSVGAARVGRSVVVGLSRVMRGARGRGGPGGPAARGLPSVGPICADPPTVPVVASARPAPALPPVVPVRSVRAELGERISLGTRSRRLTAESVLPDEALRGWVAEQSHLHDYDLVRIVCAFRPQDGERFVWARLVVRLVSAPGGPPAVVVSMLPTSEQTVASRRRVVRLGANLKLLEAATETESSSSLSYPRLTALGTLQSTAEWHLHSPALLFGEREFLLVLERAAGSPVTCVFDVHVGIEWGRDDGGEYTAELPPEMRQLVLP